jgi:hypothetical protein
MDGPVQDVVDAYVKDVAPPGADGVVSANTPRIRGLTRTARLVRASLQDLNGQDVHELALGQPFRVVVSFEVLEKIDNVVVEVGISTRSGLRILTLNSHDGGQPLLHLAPGAYAMTVQFDQTLLPNRYGLDFAMHHLRGVDAHAIEWLPQVLHFSALGDAADGHDRYPWAPVRGFVRPHATWSDVEKSS